MFGLKKTEKKKSRFARLNENSPTGYYDADFDIIVDKITGVNYIYMCNFNCSGGYGYAAITPLLEADGKPVVTDTNIFEN